MRLGPVPGEWRWADHKDGNYRIFAVRGPERVSSIGSVFNNSRGLANARLVAAAPDLLAVAHDMLNIFKADLAECTCAPDDVCPLCRCKAAIAKATGETP